MQVEMSLAEMLMNAIANGKVPGVQFKRTWSDERKTFDGLQAVIGKRLDSARSVAIQEALRKAHDEMPPFKLRAENARLRKALEHIAAVSENEDADTDDYIKAVNSAHFALSSESSSEGEKP